MIASASPNIAFIKYWGKRSSTAWHDRNIGLNPSLSLTLSQARTETEVRRRSAGPSAVFINQQPASEKDSQKVLTHVREICRELGLDPQSAFEIHSKNNFPQGTGIASSASAFVALTLATLGEVLGREQARSYLTVKNSELSRLARCGSGSAARSVAGPFMKWDGEFATPIASTWKLRDTILIFSREHKQVPSTEGHERVLSSPLYQERLAMRVRPRLAAVENAIAQRDLHLLGPLIEEEAEEMHRVSESGLPPVIYQKAETRQFIAALKAQTSRDFYFTLDAGPNLHVISERPVRGEMEALLHKLGITAEIWEDWTGEGPVLHS